RKASHTTAKAQPRAPERETCRVKCPRWSGFARLLRIAGQTPASCMLRLQSPTAVLQVVPCRHRSIDSTIKLCSLQPARRGEGRRHLIDMNLTGQCHLALHASIENGSPPDPDRISLPSLGRDQPAGAYIGRM